MENMFWEMMLVELKGNKFNNYGLNVLAQTMTGEVKESKQHLLLTTRLYEPTAAERFAAK